ncbi:hypothetical protein OFN97_06205 [Campylobacter sp. VBCF_05 NA6]|uniref:hypothetical protein n=1 Tax=unclassified Campylobacter TaxID=2593542 RepID=UPI0022E99A7C|nr:MULTISPECIES: hypothetical protein [unclassified Campylobacter]MDA3057031.1 hypothetical protein [Campylobacter sp. VBCF_04 NA7]MDA3059604.1 hypothetical protein [Campylobacter sp. VBCF_05 NA6]
MENLNSKNDFFNKNRNLRDYDKEPLILRDYSREITFHNILNSIFFLISLIIFMAILGIKNYADFNDIMEKILIWLTIFIVLLLIDYSIIFLSKERRVSLSNTKATYYNADLKIYKIYSLLGNKEFSSFLYAINRIKNVFVYPFLIFSITGFLFTFDSDFIIGLLVCIFVVFSATMYDVLFRMLVYKKSNKNLANFLEYSQKFVIDIGWKDGGRIVTPGATICFFNQNDHDLLKEYFFAIFHLNLDKDIKKLERIKIF